MSLDNSEVGNIAQYETNTPNADKPTLESLPPEILSTIFLMLDSSKTLLSLLTASRRMLSVYQDGAKQAMARAGFNTFEDHAILADACASASARASSRYLDPFTALLCQNNVHPGHKLVESWPLENLRRLIGATLDPRELRHPLPDETLITGLHIFHLSNDVDYFVKDFAATQLNRLRDYVENAAYFDENKSMDADMVPESTLDTIPLSQTERGRLQRAFCRFQLLVCLNRIRGEKPLNEQTASASALLRHYSVYEVEEIASVKDYIITKLMDLLTKIEDTFVLKHELALRFNGYSKMCPSGFCPKTNCVSCNNQECSHKIHLLHTDYKTGWALADIEYMSSLGLKFLHNLFTASMEEQVRMISENRDPCCFRRSWISTPMLKFLKGNNMSNRPVTNKQITDFKSDELNECNYGWLWMWMSGIHNPLYCYEIARAGRETAIMMWDRYRLEASGLLECSFRDIYCTLRLEYNRQPSAEEQLSGEWTHLSWARKEFKSDWGDVSVKEHMWNRNNSWWIWDTELIL